MEYRTLHIFKCLSMMLVFHVPSRAIVLHPLLKSGTVSISVDAFHDAQGMHVTWTVLSAYDEKV